MTDQWEVCCVRVDANGGPASMPPDWEPFSADQGVIWCRRRVQERIVAPVTPSHGRGLTAQEMAKRQRNLVERQLADVKARS